MQRGKYCTLIHKIRQSLLGKVRSNYETVKLKWVITQEMDEETNKKFHQTPNRPCARHHSINKHAETKFVSIIMKAQIKNTMISKDMALNI